MKNKKFNYNDLLLLSVELMAGSKL